MITIVDYGVGNIGSLINMFRRIGQEAELTSEPQQIVSAERLLLPGVGAFDAATAKLSDGGFDVAIREFVRTGRPLLGICLGMQLLLDSSEEGTSRGLGLIPGGSVRFDDSGGTRVPHMGWNQLAVQKPAAIVDGLPENHRFYFVHSYRVVVADARDELARSEYGGEFTSMVQRENVTGAQFHPEKSHAFGMQMLDQWARS
ncbi:imidazole glycerol phosphate synthase subunit HisH [Microbacterium sp. BLY]|uniref:imidazole glycerol phosphate synthase subunit HisH n=1 Tax=Microbacterium sp. BLY TaxID=2823280 RepID=UPI001B337133|nr:imidazole glycerol phosphate synthase subunit HisH [Microbacterium sp. BLY]MBP3977584.1 imidazole glycerol phosphate synthase subunit HisH [Microbacterium sp. BLY]